MRAVRPGRRSLAPGGAMKGVPSKPRCEFCGAKLPEVEKGRGKGGFKLRFCPDRRSACWRHRRRSWKSAYVSVQTKMARLRDSKGLKTMTLEEIEDQAAKAEAAMKAQSEKVILELESRRLGEAVRWLRREAGWTHGDMATALGVSIGRVADVESGRAPPYTLAELNVVGASFMLSAKALQVLITKTLELWERNATFRTDEDGTPTEAECERRDESDRAAVDLLE